MNVAHQTWILVAMAGAAGTLLRYALGGWIARATGAVFPWETLIINVSGCLAIGIAAGALDKGALIPPPLRMALMVGFIGGFTTFSTFALDVFRLASGGEWIATSCYVFLSNFLGFVAIWAAYRVTLLV